MQCHLICSPKTQDECRYSWWTVTGKVDFQIFQRVFSYSMVSTWTLVESSGKDAVLTWHIDLLVITILQHHTLPTARSTDSWWGSWSLDVVCSSLIVCGDCPCDSSFSSCRLHFKDMEHWTWNALPPATRATPLLVLFCCNSNVHCLVIVSWWVIHLSGQSNCLDDPCFYGNENLKILT